MRRIQGTGCRVAVRAVSRLSDTLRLRPRCLLLLYLAAVFAPTPALADGDQRSGQRSGQRIEQWYVGTGAGVSQLEPDAEDDALRVERNIGDSAMLYLGRDLDGRTSVQATALSLGSAEFDGGDDILVSAFRYQRALPTL